MSWGERLADFLLRQSAPRRVPEPHEMDQVQRAIHSRAFAAGMEEARRRRPTAAEARMALLEALDAEVRLLRAQAARDQQGGEILDLRWRVAALEREAREDGPAGRGA
jgi:hypothetical protein